MSTHHDASWALMATMSLNVSLRNCSYTENSTVLIPSGSKKKKKTEGGTLCQLLFEIKIAIEVNYMLRSALMY